MSNTSQGYTEHKGVKIQWDLSETKDGEWTGTCTLTWPDGTTEPLAPKGAFTTKEKANETAVEDAMRFIDHPKCRCITASHAHAIPCDKKATTNDRMCQECRDRASDETTGSE